MTSNKKEILAEYHRLVKATMNQNGFKREGIWYIRLMNREIYQHIHFQGSSYGEQFTVNIGIEPVCISEIKNYHDVFSTIRLGRFRYERDEWWNYESEALNEVIDTIENDAVPLLQSITSYEEFYKALAPLSNSSTDIASAAPRHLDIFYSFQHQLFNICIVLGQYDDAARQLDISLEAIEEGHANRLASFKMSAQEYKDTKYAESFQESIDDELDWHRTRLAAIADQKNKLANGEYDALLAVINQIEQQNLDTLKKYIVE